MKFYGAKKFVAAALFGAFAFSIPVTADASRIHDPKVETKVVSRDTHSGNSLSNLLGKFYLPSVPENVEVVDDYSDPNYYGTPQPFNDFDTFDTQPEFSVPSTVSTYDNSIIGTPLATQQQCVKYLLRNNPNPNLPVSAEQIVAYYYEEGEREGIRPDVAFAQALKETGFFRYGGDVIPEQNNYCGLGTTGGGVKGEFFRTPQLGVRAHIQHLLAYSSTRRPTMPVVDPRYSLVREAYGSRTLGTWQDLNGRWAVPGRYYGQEIMSMFRAILVQ